GPLGAGGTVRVYGSSISPASTSALAAAPTATSSPMVEQMVDSSAVHYPYAAASPGGGCDPGRAPWVNYGVDGARKGVPTARQTCYGDHTHMALTVPYVGYPNIGTTDEMGWGTSELSAPLPLHYTLRLTYSNLSANAGIALWVWTTSATYFITVNGSRTSCV